MSQQLHRAAATDATVLLEGESGTGKELFARALHALSPRADGPFVAINCAAIPETLLETELFGHEKGAFTGAVGAQAGRFELAHGGTLFLDEIGDLPLALQAKILRALEEQRVRARRRHAIAARRRARGRRDQPQPEGRAWPRAVPRGPLLPASVFPIEIPPLRDRRRHPILARHFVEVRHDLKKAGVRWRSRLDELQAYPWPGNVRELQNSPPGGGGGEDRA